ncbi:MAG: type I-C CRISPR-associated protein Cas5c [Lachnospiraceae bacterium]
MSIMYEVWGDYAAFNRPEFKTERVTYDCITPSAARGILEAVYWHPGLKYTIDEIYICNQIQTTNIRRNEVKEKISASNVKKAMNNGKKDTLYLSTKDSIQQRAALVLKNVRYVIKAHFSITEKANETDNPGKFQDILTRRLQSGKCYYTPYLGVREFPAYFRIWDKEKEVPVAYKEEKDLGYMLYDMDYNGESGIEPMFFHAVLKDGRLDLRNCEVLK